MTDGMWMHRQIHKEELYEKCVNCKELTWTPKLLHIALRQHYVEGVGQLCHECWNIIYPKKERTYDELG